MVEHRRATDFAVGNFVVCVCVSFAMANTCGISTFFGWVGGWGSVSLQAYDLHVHVVVAFRTRLVAC